MSRASEEFGGLRSSALHGRSPYFARAKRGKNPTVPRPHDQIRTLEFADPRNCCGQGRGDEVNSCEIVMQHKKMARGLSAKARRAKASRDPANAEQGPSTDPDDTAGRSIPVVGIGASAGGIEALGRFFDAMPADSGCAFVVVLHLDPQRESEMAHILAARTTMPVVQVEDGMRIRSDHVYVIAPDTELQSRQRRAARVQAIGSPWPPPSGRCAVPIARRRPTRTGHRHRAVRNRQQRHRGVEGDQGGGWHKSGADARDREIRRHAEKRNGGRNGRSRSCSGKDAEDCTCATSRHGYAAAPVEVEPAAPDGRGEC